MSGGDIAFMKPVDASSIYDDKHNPELLTNGQSCKNGTIPAAATLTEDKPWFRIDLQGKFYIRTVIVTPRRGKFNRQNFKEYYQGRSRIGLPIRHYCYYKIPKIKLQRHL